MRYMERGTEVRIRAPKSRPRPLKGLDAAFEGQRGMVVDVEGGPPKMYRVRLHEPVEIEGVGRVTDDLWCREYLRRARS